MTGEDLLQKCGAAARHAEDEDGLAVPVGGAGQIVQLGRGVVGQAVIHLPRHVIAIVWPTANGVGLGRVCECFVIAAEMIQQIRGGKVQLSPGGRRQWIGPTNLAKGQFKGFRLGIETAGQLPAHGDGAHRAIIGFEQGPGHRPGGGGIAGKAQCGGARRPHFGLARGDFHGPAAVQKRAGDITCVQAPIRQGLVGGGMLRGKARGLAQVAAGVLGCAGFPGGETGAVMKLGVAPALMGKCDAIAIQRVAITGLTEERPCFAGQPRCGLTGSFDDHEPPLLLQTQISQPPPRKYTLESTVYYRFCANRGRFNSAAIASPAGRPAERAECLSMSAVNRRLCIQIFRELTGILRIAECRNFDASGGVSSNRDREVGR